MIWYYRLEFYYLQTVQLLDTLNPIHISCLWWSHASHIRNDIDDSVSQYNGKTMGPCQSMENLQNCPKFIFQSLFRDLSGGNYINVYKPNIINEEYDEYVKKVDEWVLNHQQSIERQYKLPSEMWISTENEEAHEPEFSEDMDFAQNIDWIAKEEKNEWNDDDIKKIMEGRGKAKVEYLSALGQQIRCQLVDGLMYQMVKQKSFGNSSQFRQLQFLFVLCVTEVILEECGIEMRNYSLHVMNKKELLKAELSVGINEILELYEIGLEDLVNPQLL